MAGATRRIRRILKRRQRTELKRRPVRGSYDVNVVHGILDEAPYCHVGFVVEGQPYVMPTIHARVDNQLYIHGSVASRMLRTMSEGIPLCVTVTLLDGLILARSAFHHSMNYRSVVILGAAIEVTDHDEKLSSLKAIVEHIMPGRWDDVRRPSKQEIKATKVLRIPIEEASAKIRTGPPIDDEEDYALECWAGEIPVRWMTGAAIPDPRLSTDITIPEYITSNFFRRSNSQA